MLNSKLPAGPCALRVATVAGPLANLALPNVRRVQGPRRTNVLSVLLALIRSTALVCKRTAAVFARVHLLSPTITSMSVIVSDTFIRFWTPLSQLSQVVVQSVLLANFRASALRRRSTRFSALVACLVMSFTRGLACKAVLRAPSYLPQTTSRVPVRNLCTLFLRMFAYSCYSMLFVLWYLLWERQLLFDVQ